MYAIWPTGNFIYFSCFDNYYLAKNGCPPPPSPVVISEQSLMVIGCFFTCSIWFRVLLSLRLYHCVNYR